MNDNCNRNALAHSLKILTGTGMVEALLQIPEQCSVT